MGVYVAVRSVCSVADTVVKPKFKKKHQLGYTEIAFNEGSRTLKEDVNSLDW